MEGFGSSASSDNSLRDTGLPLRYKIASSFAGREKPMFSIASFGKESVFVIMVLSHTSQK
tara:strand:+ start:202 stop:381 length:180 start_codon:yes stop_codon:yes gene_type:complete